MATYHLMNKDQQLLTFTEPNALGVYTIVCVDETQRHLFPPVFTSGIDERNLRTFIENRTVSVNRHHMEIVVGKLNLKTKFDMLRYCKGLALTDTYWVRPDYETVTWADCNLYHNKFDQALGWMAFTGVPSDVSKNLSTPELTTVGVLPKYWDREASKVFLVKGGTLDYANAGLEPISEVCASVIAVALGLNAIDYTYRIMAVKGKQKPASICRLFTSEAIGLLTAQEFKQVIGLEKSSLSLEDYMKAMEAHGLDIAPLKRMIFFDDLVRNPDRHLNNWGFSVDNVTGQLIGFAPIWDTGEALIAKTMDMDFPLMMTSEEAFSSFGIMYKGLRPLFYHDQEKADCRRMIAMVDSGALVAEFKTRNIPVEDYPKLELIAQIVKTRATMILQDLGERV